MSIMRQDFSSIFHFALFVLLLSSNVSAVRICGGHTKGKGRHPPGVGKHNKTSSCVKASELYASSPANTPSVITLSRTLTPENSQASPPNSSVSPPSLSVPLSSPSTIPLSPPSAAPISSPSNVPLSSPSTTPLSTPSAAPLSSPLATPPVSSPTVSSIPAVSPPSPPETTPSPPEILPAQAPTYTRIVDPPPAVSAAVSTKISFSFCLTITSLASLFSLFL